MAEVQIPAITGVYLWSVHTQDQQLHDFSTTLMSAYAITSVSTVLLKAAANTDRPNGEQHGFPSYHASSSFAIASVLDEYYGYEVGIPAYTLAGLIGWSRIDQRHHDLSDVVFGAALGFVVGKAVAGHELRGDSRVRLLPWNDPANRSTGIQMELAW